MPPPTKRVKPWTLSESSLASHDRCAADFFGLPNPSIGNALEGLGVVIGRIPRPHVDRPSNRPRADAGMTGRERDRLASPRTGTGNQRFLSLKQGRTRQFAITGAGRLWLFCENGIRGGTARLSRICIFEHVCLRLAGRRASRGPFPIRRSCFRFLTKSLRSSGDLGGIYLRELQRPAERRRAIPAIGNRARVS